MFRYSKSRNQWKGDGSVAGDAQHFDKFNGETFVVDLSTIAGDEQDFQGKKWLEQCFKEQRPVGWSVMWKADRVKDSDNPISAMQFASADSALILRTHITKKWLPDVIDKVLRHQTFMKVCIGYQGGESDIRKKMLSSFNIGVQGIIDLEEVAKRKNVEGKGLKALAACCECFIRNDSRIARSDWMATELSEEQVQYAAEAAFFAHHIWSRLEAKPDFKEEKNEGDENLNKGILTIKPEWEGIIDRRLDGLYYPSLFFYPIRHVITDPMYPYPYRVVITTLVKQQLDAYSNL